MKKVHQKAPAESLRRFREWRYGMFIHYGLYSLLGRHEWALCYERIPFTEYRQLASRFRPKPGCARDWVALAKTAGMRYACLTTRHHEGFALFDTQVSAFKSRRDLVAEFVTACRQAKIGVGLYYSVGDWGSPGFLAGPKKNPRAWKQFVSVVHAQLRELMTNYGRIDYLFYDGCPPPKTWGCAAINAEIRRLQPHILISSRCGVEEDVMSAEGSTISDPGKLWETCLTTNRSWGYNSGDPDWKTPRATVLDLMTCCHNGGNFLLNIGPKADGSIPAPAVRLLRRVGAWVKRNAEAIYGTRPHPFDYADKKHSTGRGQRVYVALQYYHGPESVVAGIGNRVKAVRLLKDGRRIRCRQEGNRVFLTGLPGKAPDPTLTVLAFDLAGKPRGVPNRLLPKFT
jgi:alpha-L-fucosidase